MSSLTKIVSKLTVPIRTKTGNAGHGREHWAVRHKRVKQERRAVALLWPRGFYPRLPVAVKLVRVRPGGKDLDTDNLSGALKAIRDQVAEQLKIDDGDKSAATWSYAQERGEWAVRIEIEHSGSLVSLARHGAQGEPATASVLGHETPRQF